MTFFYDLNKRLADLAKKQELTESAQPAVAEASTGDYSAKKARAGKDIGKPGKTFAKIAKSAGERYGSKERGEKVAGAVLAKLRAKESVDETVTDEGNAFGKAVRDAKADGIQPGEKIKVGGKEYPVKEEGGVPMTAKQKSFAKLAPPKDKITFADKIAGAKKEVDEMLGDVAAEAIKKAVKKSEPRSKGTAFDPETAKGMFAHKDKHPRYDVKDTGYSKRYTRKEEPEEKDDEEVSDAPKKKGRPKGPAKGPERTTKGAWKHKGERKEKTEEDLDTDGVMMTRQSNMSSESIDPADHGEYDREGEMAKQQIHTIMTAAKKLHGMLGDDENLPEWVQKKITMAKDYIDTAADYMASRDAEDKEQEPVAEKAVSKAQRKAAGIAHAAKKGEIPKSELRGASKEMVKMPAGELKKFAKTKEKGLPEKVKAKKEESVEETSEAPKEKKSSGGFQFGKGVYESFNKKYTQLLSEGMNVSVNMSTGADGNPTKNITVSAEGEDAEALAKLLQMAGIKGNSHDESLDENSPDWPTNTETSDDALQYSGGLNKPKSTGQTTVPVIASQLRRQVSMEEGVELERSLFKLYQAYKAK